MRFVFAQIGVGYGTSRQTELGSPSLYILRKLCRLVASQVFVCIRIQKFALRRTGFRLTKVPVLVIDYRAGQPAPGLP